MPAGPGRPTSVLNKHSTKDVLLVNFQKLSELLFFRKANEHVLPKILTALFLEQQLVFQDG